MDKIQSISKGEDLVAYSACLAELLFAGITRQSGLPYTQEHLARVAEKVSLITLPSEFRNSSIAAAWLHDSAEDIDDIDVQDSFSSAPATRKSSKTYLNDLLAEAGIAGKRAAYLVNLVTNRSSVSYYKYVRKIFRVSTEEAASNMSGEFETLHKLAGIIKSADLRLNTNPDESVSFNKVVSEYLSLKGAQPVVLEAFYKKTKTIDAFRKRKDLNIDVKLFVETLDKRHKLRQGARAIDNLGLYLPLAERKLLVETPKENSLFDWNLMRGLLKEAYIDSLRMFPGDIYSVRMLGFNNRAPKISGYTSIRSEIRKDLADGAYEIEKKD